MWYKYTIFFPFKSSKLYVLAQNISWKFVNLFRFEQFHHFPSPCPRSQPVHEKTPHCGVFVLFWGSLLYFCLFVKERMSSVLPNTTN